MHKFLSFDHKILLASQIFLPAVSSATFYGRGIFTSLAVYNSKPFQWTLHWRRLAANAKAIDLDLSEFTEASVQNSLSEIIARNNFETGRARLTFFDETAGGGGLWESGSQRRRRRTSLLIASADFRPP